MIDFDALVIGPLQHVFGEEVVHHPVGRLAQTVTGVFDRAYLELTPLGGGPQEPAHFGASGNITDRKPILGVQLSQFAKDRPPRQGDWVTLPNRKNPGLDDDYQATLHGLRFEIMEVQEDGQGGAKLLLVKSY